MAALARQVDILRAQLKVAEVGLEQARDRLAQLQGKPAAALPIQIEMWLAGSKGKPVAARQMVLRVRDGKIVAVSPAKKDPPRPEELKSRIERLLREVEELRREIQRTPELKSPLPK